MSFGPQVVMPGAFHHFDTPNDSSASLSGVHPGIFRQPVSPSPSTSVYLGRSSGSLYSDASTPAQNVKRKRQVVAREPTPLNDWTITGDSMVEGRKPDLGSRKISGGKRRYVLAGQINTPNGGATAREYGDSSMEDSAYSDIDYRRALGSKRPHAEFDSPTIPDHTTGLTSGGQHPRQFGWSAFALQTIGGVVGKVWEFCRTGAFRGFYAGGGKGYDMQPPTPSEQQGQQQTYSKSGGHEVWCNEHDIPTLPSYDRPSSSGYPQSDYSPYYYERETPEESMTTPPPPAPKRRQIHDEASSTSRSGDESIRRNWVVVDEPAHDDTKPQQRAPSTSSFASRVPTGSYNPRYYQKQYQRPSSAVPRRSNLSSRSINRLDPPRFNNHCVSHAGASTVISTNTINTTSPLSSPSKSHEPASYASPRSTASAAPVGMGMGMGPAAAAIAMAAPASPTYLDPQRSPSRIPVPVSHESRPQTPSNNIGGRAAAYSPASRIASPSPNPYATKIRSGGGHQRRQSTASTASTAMPRPSSSGSNYRRTPVKGVGAGAGGLRAKRADSMGMGGMPGAAARTTSPTKTATTSTALDHKESSSNNNSPRLDREAKRLAAQRRQAEREADLRINDFNARLREMIRQGKEALGTSVEVDLLDDDVDGGRADPWADD